MSHVHGQVTETNLCHTAIYINIKTYQNRVSVKAKVFLTASIIIRSSHYLSMKPPKKRATSDRTLVELGT